MCLAVQTILGPPGEKKERKPEEHSLAINRNKIPNGGQKRSQFGGPSLVVPVKERQEGLIKRQ